MIAYPNPFRPQTRTREERKALKALTLKLMVARVEAMISTAGRDDAVHLVEEEGGKFEFRTGAHVVRMGGVTGTSTHGYPAALKSWLGIATRKLEKLS